MGRQEQASTNGLDSGLLSAVQQGIIDRLGADSPVVSAEIRPNKRMTAAARFAIYSRDYYGRMRDVLKQDYGLVAKVLGADAWDRLADAFVVAYPSRHPNVNYYGQEFSSFLRSKASDEMLIGVTTPSVPSGLLADIALLERAVAQAPMSDSKPPLTAESVAALPARVWPTARLTVIPSVSVLTLDWPVNELLTTYLAGEEFSIPTELSTQTVQVWHSQGITWRRTLPPIQVALLASIMGGGTLGESLDQAAQALLDRGETAEDAAASVQGWFAAWMADGIFCGIEVE